MPKLAASRPILGLARKAALICRIKPAMPRFASRSRFVGLTDSSTLWARRLREAPAVRYPHLIDFGETTRWLLIAETTNDVLFESVFMRAGPKGQMFAAIAARLLQNCEMRLERKNN